MNSLEAFDSAFALFVAVLAAFSASRSWWSGFLGVFWLAGLPVLFLLLLRLLPLLLFAFPFPELLPLGLLVFAPARPAHVKLISPVSSFTFGILERVFSGWEWKTGPLGPVGGVSRVWERAGDGPRESDGASDMDGRR